MQLKVVKADGSIEEYLHTKVVGTINNALVLAGDPNISIAEQLAEAITYFLYSKEQRHKATSSEILSMIQVVLAATSYEDAAIALVEYHHRRRLKRRRVEVIDDEALKGATAQDRPAEPWNKSRIVHDLVAKRKLGRQVSRVIASMVEERVLNLGVTRVSRDLITQLVLADTAAVAQAEQQLRAGSAQSCGEEGRADMDVRLRQQQKGLCTVEL